MKIVRRLGVLLSVAVALAAGAWWLSVGGIPQGADAHGTVGAGARERLRLPAGTVTMTLRDGSDASVVVRRRQGDAPLATTRIPAWTAHAIFWSEDRPVARVKVPASARYTVSAEGAGGTVLVGRAPWTPFGSIPAGAALITLLLGTLLLASRSLVYFLVPELGLFEPVKSYKGRRAKSAPAGWVVTDALVERVEREGTGIKLGVNREERVYRATITYVVVQPDGRLASLVDRAEISGNHLPKVGARLTLAYDPADASKLVILEDERERNGRLVAYLKEVDRSGTEAPVTVLDARPTGRVARPHKSTPRDGPGLVAPWARGKHAASVPVQAVDATEKWLTLRVEPPGAAAFEVTRSYWDEGNVGPGTRGLLFYRPHEPEQGVPVFARAEHAVNGTEALGVARDQLLSALAAGR